MFFIDLVYLRVKLPFDALTLHALAGSQCIVAKCMFCTGVAALQVKVLFEVVAQHA